MKIAIIGQNTINDVETELATQFVQSGHKTNLYLNRKKGIHLLNGMNVFYGRYLFTVLHALYIFGADIIFLRKEVEKYAWIISMISPKIVVKTGNIPQGIYLKRLATNDVILGAHGLEVGNYAILRSGVDVTPEVIHRMQTQFGATFQLVAIDEQTYHREVLQALYAGSAFVIGNTDFLEMMSYGKLVLTPANAVCSHIDDVIMAFENEEELVQIMSQLLLDPMLRASLGHTAREFAESQRWEVVSDTYLTELKREYATRSRRFDMIRTYVRR